MALLDHLFLPIGGQDDIPLLQPPHVQSGAIDELELEVVDRGLGADLKAELVVGRKRHRDLAAGDRMAAAPVEIEIEAHGHPRVALVLCDIELDAF